VSADDETFELLDDIASTLHRIELLLTMRDEHWWNRLSRTYRRARAVIDLTEAEAERQGYLDDMEASP